MNGGGFYTYNRVCARMAQSTGQIVVSVEYRLAPEYRFPTALLDCYAAAEALYGGKLSLKTSPKKITVMGDSAGGNLAAAVTMARNRGDFTVKRQILIYPALKDRYTEASPYLSVKENGTDYLLTAVKMEDYLKLYESSPKDRENPYFAPLLEKDLSNLPDTLILTAEFDPLRDEGEDFGRKLKEAGNQVEVHRIKDALHCLSFRAGDSVPSCAGKLYLYECVFAGRSVRSVETGYSKWRKLDNAALAFPLVTGKDDTRVFRFYCELREAVDEEILQKALEETMEKYPLFQAVLRKGLFWFYLEHRDIRPVVKKEKSALQQGLISDKKSLLFEVSYHENRINFEVYHALTDGTGAMYFLEELVQNYLILAHPEAKLPRIEPVEEITPGDQEEDSFSPVLFRGSSEK